MSTFAQQRTWEIFRNASTEPLSSPPLADNDEIQHEHSLQTLRSTLEGLNAPPDDEQLLQSLEVLNDSNVSNVVIGENSYMNGISERVLAGIYARAMDSLLQQALDSDKEARFWWDVERSWWNASRFLVQTLPLRAQRLGSTFVQSLRHRNIPITFSTFSIGSIKHLFPTTTHPSELLVAAFPHLRNHHFFSTSPIALTAEECREKRKQLEALRDDRALRLGILTSALHDLEYTMSSKYSNTPFEQHIGLLQTVLSVDGNPQIIYRAIPDNGMLFEVSESRKAYNEKLKPLRRPSRLVQIWPRILIIPPALYLMLRFVYNARGSIIQHAHEAVETVRAFWESWILQPTRNIIATVRTGGDEGVRVISKDALKADLDSLERMAVALGREKLAYSPEQLGILQDQIRQGDLTAVLRVYEEDIKAPIRSAVTGTLVRSLLIQVQKLKVDVDFALSGIDKLLRSQELTFGFVGVAPALAVVYLTFGWLNNLWRGDKGRGSYGGKRERARLWHTMRRIEKLLISQPKLLEPSQVELLSACQALGFVRTAANTGTYRHNGASSGSSRSTVRTPRTSQYQPHTHLQSRPQSQIANDDPEETNGVNTSVGSASGSGSLSPLTNGLLLLSTTHLRTFAEAYLRRSRFKTGFLDDVTDLEDGRLSVEQKRLVFTRMWRSWGRPLGWDNLAQL